MDVCPRHMVSPRVGSLIVGIVALGSPIIFGVANPFSFSAREAKHVFSMVVKWTRVGLIAGVVLVGEGRSLYSIGVGAMLGSHPDRALARRTQEPAWTPITVSGPRHLISPRNCFAGEASPGRHDNQEHDSNDSDSEGERTNESIETPEGPDPDDGPGSYDGAESVDDASDGDEKRGAFRRLASSWLTLALFSILVIGRMTLQYIDIYSSPVAYAVSLPSYLVTMIFYDEGFLDLEPLVNAASAVVPIDGSFLWEAINVVTYYLVALLIAALYRWGRRAMA